MLIVFSIISLLLTIPALLLLTEVLSALLLPDRDWSMKRQDTTNVSFVILVPAHNEEDVLNETLVALLEQVPDPSNILVVADNCTDETAKIAKNCGVNVLERFNEKQNGKGYALDYGIQYLIANPPEVLVIMDADCQVRKGLLTRLVDVAFSQKRPVQSAYTMACDEKTKVHNRIAALAFLFKNFIRPLGLAKLGWPCLLTGTGMAFPWNVVQKVNFATGNIVEDMQIGIDLSIAGLCPLFLKDVNVISVFPEEKSAILAQRTRWEHGHLYTIIHQLPMLIVEAKRQCRLDLLVLALDVSVPPLSLYVFVTTAFIFLAGLITFLEGECLLLVVASSPLMILSIALLLGWGRFGTKIISLQEFARVPFYILLKIPLYIKFLINREKVWNKTKRNGKQLK